MYGIYGFESLKRTKLYVLCGNITKEFFKCARFNAILEFHKAKITHIKKTVLTLKKRLSIS